MELRHLAHFLAVADEGSFTRGAARVNVVQSALSLSIRNLERELGAQLFNRSTHHVELSAAGRALLPEARNILQAAEVARDVVADTVGGVRGTLRLGLMHSVGSIDLAGLLTRYHRQWPGVRIVPSAAGGGSSELLRGVREGHLDVAFTAMPEGYPAEIVVMPIASEPLGLVCPPDHRYASRRDVRLGELAGERFVDLPRGWGARESVDRLFSAHGFAREVTVEVPDTSVLTDLVLAGLGFAFLTRSLLGPSPPVALVPVRPCADFSVSLISSADRPLPAAARRFIELTAGTYPPA